MLGKSFSSKFLMNNMQKYARMHLVINMISLIKTYNQTILTKQSTFFFCENADNNNNNQNINTKVERKKSIKMKCFNCGDYGHMAKDCKTGVKCYNCDQIGHKSNECPNPQKPVKEKTKQTIKCYICNQEGHMSRECPQNRGKLKCFNCGQEGHKSFECPNPKNENKL